MLEPTVYQGPRSQSPGGQAHTDHRKPGPHMLASGEGLAEFVSSGGPDPPQTWTVCWIPIMVNTALHHRARTSTPVVDLCSSQTDLLPRPLNHIKRVRISRPHHRGLCPGVRELGQPWLEQHPKLITVSRTHHRLIRETDCLIPHYNVPSRRQKSHFV